MLKAIIPTIALLATGLTVQPIYAKTKGHTPPQGKNAIIRVVSPFNGIQVSGNVTLTVDVGAKQTVALQVSKKLASCISTDVNNAILYIHSLNTPNCQNQKLALFVAAPKLTSIMSQGNSSANIKGILTRSFITYASGNSLLTLHGNTESVNIDLSGDSALNAKHFSAKRVVLQTSGNSLANIRANEALFAQGSGNSTINYTGHPKTILKSLSGNSTLINLAK